MTPQLTITNRADEVLAERGLMPADQVRRVTLDEVLIDTGAMSLSLPSNVIQQLGLSPLREVLASTAAGYQRTTLYQDAKISLLGRDGVFQCLELPGGENPLLGVVPMEELDVEIDSQKQEVKLLPMEPGNSYFLAYGHTLYKAEAPGWTNSKGKLGSHERGVGRDL